MYTIEAGELLCRIVEIFNAHFFQAVNNLVRVANLEVVVIKHKNSIESFYYKAFITECGVQEKRDGVLQGFFELRYKDIAAMCS